MSGIEVTVDESGQVKVNVGGGEQAAAAAAAAYQAALAARDAAIAAAEAAATAADGVPAQAAAAIAAIEAALEQLAGATAILDAANAAKVAAQAAAAASASSASDADADRIAAQTAKAQAETAQGAAVTAQGAAEDAQEAAEAAADTVAAVPNLATFLGTISTTDVLPPGVTEADFDAGNRIGFQKETDGRHVFTRAKVIGDLNDVSIGDVLDGAAAGLRNALMGSVARSPFDIGVLSAGGQSNGEGADSDPAVSVEEVEGLIMLEAPRMRHVPTLDRFTTGFNPAIEVDYNDGGGNDWGEEPSFGANEIIMDIRAKLGSPYKVHRQRQLVINYGQSSTQLSGLNYPSGPWTLREACATEIARLADLEGLSAGELAEIWGQGASNYDFGWTKAAWKGGLLQRADDMQTRIRPIYGQKEPIYLLIINNHHFPSRHSVDDPYGSEAESEAAEEHDFIRIVGTQYSMFGEVGTSHHSNRESKILGAMGGVAAFNLQFLKQDWDNFLPISVTAAASDLIKVSYRNVAGLALAWDYAEVVAQVGSGFRPFDGTSNAELAQKAHPWIDGDDVYIRLVNTIDANTRLHYAARTWGGNLCRKPTNPVYEYEINVDGVIEPVRRWATIFNKPVV